MGFFIGILIAVCIGSWLMTWMLRRYALSRSLMDIPNERSSHTVPTPRGGGVAIVVSFLLAVAFLWCLRVLPSGLVLSLTGAGMLVALTGFIDDHGHIPAGWRLLVHFAAAAWGLFWIGGMPSLTVFGYELALGWFGHLVAALYLVWLLNLYNFMDGIDAIAGIEAITVCIGGAVLFWLAGHTDKSNLLPVLILMAATIGFLIWNFPPAKIFLGDAGSGFVGLLLGLLSIMAAHVDQALFWGWVILLGCFTVDATVTLARRVLKGKTFYEAHRSHAYQYLSRRFGAHKPVSLIFGAINIFFLLPIAAIVVMGLIDGFLGLIITYVPLILIAIWLKAGDEAAQISNI